MCLNVNIQIYLNIQMLSMEKDNDHAIMKERKEFNKYKDLGRALTPEEDGQPASPYLHSDGQTYVWTYQPPQTSADGTGYDNGYYYWKVDENAQQQTHVETLPYVGTITNVLTNDMITMERGWKSTANTLPGELLTEYKAERRYYGPVVQYISNDLTDLTTYMSIGDDSYLLTNASIDKENNVILVKTYSPLEKNISEEKKEFLKDQELIL